MLTVRLSFLDNLYNRPIYLKFGDDSGFYSSHCMSLHVYSFILDFYIIQCPHLITLYNLVSDLLSFYLVWNVFV